MTERQRRHEYITAHLSRALHHSESELAEHPEPHFTDDDYKARKAKHDPWQNLVWAIETAIKDANQAIDPKPVVRCHTCNQIMPEDKR
jgi:hypothetical protein